MLFAQMLFERDHETIHDLFEPVPRLEQFIPQSVVARVFRVPFTPK